MELFQNLIIENTSLSDLDVVCSLFEEAIVFQEKMALPSWKNIDLKALEKEIIECRQFKLLLDDRLTGIFSICFSDPLIWTFREKGDALYLHRIVVKRAYKGQKYFQAILNWAREKALSKKLTKIRMDTWAGNSGLLDYYQRFGFKQVATYQTLDHPELPLQNRNLHLALLELCLV